VSEQLVFCLVLFSLLQQLRRLWFRAMAYGGHGWLGLECARVWVQWSHVDRCGLDELCQRSLQSNIAICRLPSCVTLVDAVAVCLLRGLIFVEQLVWGWKAFRVSGRKFFWNGSISTSALQVYFVCVVGFSVAFGEIHSGSPIVRFDLDGLVGAIFLHNCCDSLVGFFLFVGRNLFAFCNQGVDRWLTWVDRFAEWVGAACATSRLGGVFSVFVSATFDCAEVGQSYWRFTRCGI